MKNRLLKGRVAAVCVSEKKGTVKTETGSITLKKDLGVCGDAHAGPGDRQVSLLASEKIDTMREKGLKLEHGAFGENIVTSGIDFDEAPAGSVIRIGGASMVLTRHGKECHTRCAIYYRTGDCIMPVHGVFASVIEGGKVGKGDQITVECAGIPIVHILGRQDHGKTTLVVELVREFKKLGLRVGTIKHSRHEHEMDTEGKDTYQHRKAGASPSGIIATNQTAVFMMPQSAVDRYEQVLPLYRHCDLILVEGDAAGPGLKFEVWRAGKDHPPRAAGNGSILAVISDDDPGLKIPVWKRSDPAAAARKILETARKGADKPGDGALPTC